MLGPTLKVAGALVVGAAGFLAHRTGLFHGVRWRSGVKTDSFSFVFLAHQGPYASIGSKFDEVVKLLANAAKPVKVCCATHRSVGVYYDDPKATPAKELRSCAGIILEGDELTAAVNAGLPMKTVPAHENAIAADFPLQNFFSIIIGAMKAYPALEKANFGETYPEIYEIYDWPASQLTYLAFPAAAE
jgi:hypothetical protein